MGRGNAMTRIVMLAAIVLAAVCPLAMAAYVGPPFSGNDLLERCTSRDVHPA
jgi:hypothetical protein